MNDSSVLALVDLRDVTPIYPKVTIEEAMEDGSGLLEIRTNLRKEKDGVWYEWFFKQNHRRTPSISCEQKIKFLSKFHEDVYLINILGEIPDEETSYLRKSNDVRSERDRLIARTS